MLGTFEKEAGYVTHLEFHINKVQNDKTDKKYFEDDSREDCEAYENMESKAGRV